MKGYLRWVTVSGLHGVQKSQPRKHTCSGLCAHGEDLRQSEHKGKAQFLTSENDRVLSLKEMLECPLSFQKNIYSRCNGSHNWQLPYDPQKATYGL